MFNNAIRTDLECTSSQTERAIVHSLRKDLAESIPHDLISSSTIVAINDDPMNVQIHPRKYKRIMKNTYNQITSYMTNSIASIYTCKFGWSDILTCCGVTCKEMLYYIWLLKIRGEIFIDGFLELIWIPITLRVAHAQ